MTTRPTFFDQSLVYDRFAHRSSLLGQASFEPDAKSPNSCCARCGMRTHNVTLFLRKTITSEHVYQGICIRCNPETVPPRLLKDWQGRNSTSEPSERVSDPANVVGDHVAYVVSCTTTKEKSMASSSKGGLSLSQEPDAGRTSRQKETRRTPLEEQESEPFSKHPDVCARCGIHTYNLKIMRRVCITNKDVYRGTCIQCNPSAVPDKVLEEWKLKHGLRTTPCVNPMTTSMYTDRYHISRKNG
jgi:ribosomal protein L37E